MKSNRVATIKFVMAAYAAFLAVQCCPAAAAAPPKTIIFNNQRAGNYAADKVYSREEILNAKPMKWTAAPPADPRYRAGEAFTEKAPKVQGGVSSPAGTPGADADVEALRDFSGQWQVLDDEFNAQKDSAAPEAGQSKSGASINFGTADIYTSYRGNYWPQYATSYPWKAVGKLLIDGGGYCTAQSITGAPKNIIVTAAHCVYNRGAGRFYSGWTFVPAERNGIAPYGQYRWASAIVLGRWATSGTRNSDVALIKLQNNASTGQPVSYYTGWLGWRMDQPYVRSLHSIGYASNISTAWTSMCAAESYYASCEGTDVLIKGCNMTYGSSGGAWMSSYAPWQSGYVEGVVSGPSCAGSFGHTFVGPRFSSANIGVLCAAFGGCTTP